MCLTDLEHSSVEFRKGGRDECVETSDDRELERVARDVAFDSRPLFIARVGLETTEMRVKNSNANRRRTPELALGERHVDEMSAQPVFFLKLNTRARGGVLCFGSAIDRRKEKGASWRRLALLDLRVF